MQKIFRFMVDKRYLFLSLFVLLAGLSVVLIGNVNINNDFSQYLPADSETRDGYEILEDQFGNTSSLKVVFENLSDEEIVTIYQELTIIENVASVDYDDSDDYNVDNYTMFILRIADIAASDAALGVMESVQEDYPEAIVGGEIFVESEPLIPTSLIIFALIIMVVILFIFTPSWVEPFVFLISLGIAVIINMGTNVIFDSVSDITFSIGALLQLCLSIDYSIILMNRYRQEKAKETDKKEAMKKAMTNAFPSIFGSSFTTIVGLLCLIFMSFTIGADLGLVLAKGVFISMLTVFFVLPTLILLFDKAIEKSAKWSIDLNVKKMSNFGYKFRKIAPIVFIILFVGGFFLRDTAEIGYILPVISTDEATELFPDDNVIVLLYDNDDEENIMSVIAELSQDEHVIDITCYATTIGAQLTAAELSAYTGMDEMSLGGILFMAGVETISLYDFINLVLTDYQGMMTPQQLAELNAVKAMLDENLGGLVSDEYSRMIISTDYELDAEPTEVFIHDLQNTLDENLVESHFLVGTSVMADEMSFSFDSEFLKITLITIVAIFLVVAITFKSAIIPVFLVTIIQTAIFLTTGVLGMLGDNVYFLALLIVQAILMGATIDYGILFTSYFREAGSETPVKEALEHAYHGSTHTILTSASILFVITGLLGVISKDPTIMQMLRALAVGTLSSTLLVLFVLPSVLVFARKLIVRREKMVEKIKSTIGK